MCGIPVLLRGSNALGQEFCAPASEHCPCSAARFHVVEAQSRVVKGDLRVAVVRPPVVQAKDAHEEPGHFPDVVN